MNVFTGKLESTCLSLCLSVYMSVCVLNTTFCQSTGEGGYLVMSPLVTALVDFILIYEPCSGTNRACISMINHIKSSHDSGSIKSIY